MFFALIPLLLSYLNAQVPVCSVGDNIPAFKACARDSLTDPSGQVGPADITSACVSLQNDQPAYFDCLCAKASGIVNCYAIFCSGDASSNSAQQSQRSFCDAAKVYQPTGTTTAKTTRQTSQEPTSTTTSTNQKPSSGDIFNAFPIIIAFIIGLLI